MSSHLLRKGSLLDTILIFHTAAIIPHLICTLHSMSTSFGSLLLRYKLGAICGDNVAPWFILGRRQTLAVD